MQQSSRTGARGASSRHKAFKRNALAVDCFFDSKGRLQRKVESWGSSSAEYTYQFDAKGHLLKIQRNGQLLEEYEYNQRGQRMGQHRAFRGFSDTTNGTLCYDADGRLSRAGEVSFTYDKNGSLLERRDCNGITRYIYGDDTLLDKVVLPSKAELHFESHPQSPINPIRRFRRGVLTTEYFWQNPLQLHTCRDYDQLLEFTFTYNAEGHLDKVRIAPLQENSGQRTDSKKAAPVYSQGRTTKNEFSTGKSLLSGIYDGQTTGNWQGKNEFSTGGSLLSGMYDEQPTDNWQGRTADNARATGRGWLESLDDEQAPGGDWLEDMAIKERAARLHQLFGKTGKPVDLYCATDQVGTVKLLTDAAGRLVKEIQRDSFGVKLLDSLPDLFLPIGFAGGLEDPDTNLVRFGYRDYDPTVGRFTAKDPAKDMRGDKDLYDYCIDDPVSMIDPTGLMGCRPQFRANEERNIQTLPAQTQTTAPNAATAQPQAEHPVPQDRNARHPVTQTAPAQQAEQPAPQPDTTEQPAEAETSTPQIQPHHNDRPGVRRWTYNQRTGQLRDPDGNLIRERGYSGSHESAYRNNPAAEGIIDSGPIPTGWWTIHDRAPQHRPNTGAYSIELQPDGHNALTRTDFFIHGDNPDHPGESSIGCPIFTRRVRELIYNSGARNFRVVDEPEWTD